MSPKLTVLLLAAMAIVAVNGQANQCVPLGQRLLGTCDQELSFLESIYPLNSEVPPTEAQIKQVEDTKPAGLPRPACCTAVINFDKAACPCDASIITTLAVLDISATSTGLQGVTSFTGPLCDFTPTKCS